MAWARRLSSGRWQGQYRGADGRKHTATDEEGQRGSWARKSDALEAAREEERNVRRGRWVSPDERKTTFGNYAARWLESKADVRPRTLINVEGRLRNHILPTFSAVPVTHIRASDVRAWVASLDLAPSTVKATFRTFGQIIRMAEIDGLIVRSPLLGVEEALPAERSHEEMHFLSPEQVAELADAIGDRFTVAIFTAAYTGLRAGELWALTLPRVNLLRRRLEVVEQVAEVRGKLVIGRLKTKHSRRMVSLPAFLADMIGEHVGRFPSEDGYVFTAPEGGAVRHHNFMDRHFYPALRASKNLPDGLRFHDLRHSCAAILIAQGWGAKQIQERLGHASIRTTLDAYGHLFEGHDAQLLDKLDASIRETSR